MKKSWKKRISLAILPIIPLTTLPLMLSIYYQKANKNYISSSFKILNKSITKENMSIFIFGDGFTESEQNQFYQDAEKATEFFFKQPQYKQLKNYLNVIAVGAISKNNFHSRLPQSHKDTYFETHSLRSDERLVELTENGNSKFRDIKREIKSRLNLDTLDTREHIFINANGNIAVSTWRHSFSSAREDRKNNYRVFLHEMTHNFGMGDEYYYSSESTINTTMVDDPEKIKWKEFLGFRNTGIREKEKRRILGYGTGSYKYGPLYRYFTPRHKCMMEDTQSSFCEVCQYHSFKTATQLFKNPPMYISRPYISETFDSLKDYNSEKIEISDSNLNEANGKILDFRYLADNPTNKDMKLKLRFEYINKTNSSLNQSAEEEFTIKPYESKTDPKPKQIKVSFKEPLKFNQNDNASIIARVINAETNEEIVNNRIGSFGPFDTFDYVDQKKISIDFIDMDNNKPIDFINSQTYYYNSKDDISNFKQTNIRGYDFVKSEETELNGNKKWKWYYKKTKSRKIKLNLRNTIDDKIIKTRETEIFEGEVFKPDQFDFEKPNDFHKGNINFNRNIKIAFNDTNKKEIDYWIDYPNYRISTTNDEITIEQGDEVNFSILGYLQVQTRDDVWTKNNNYKMVINKNNFNKNITGEYKIKYQYLNAYKEIKIKVVENSSLSENKKAIIAEMTKLKDKYPIANNLASKTDIKNATKENIENYVNNWPKNIDDIKVELTDFKKNEYSGKVEATFKYTKNGESLTHTFDIEGFLSDELIVDNEIKRLDNESNIFKLNQELINKTNAKNFNSDNVHSFFTKLPNASNNEIKIRPVITEEKSPSFVVAFKVTKGSITKITNGFWVSGFKETQDESDKEDESKKNREEFETKIDRISISSKQPIASKTLAKNVNKNNYSEYIEGIPSENEIINFVVMEIKPYSADEKNTKVSLSIKYVSKKDATLSRIKNYVIDGFMIDPQSIKNEEDKKIIDFINSINIKINEKGKKVLPSIVDNSNIKQYVDGIPENLSNDIKITIDTVKNKNDLTGSLTIQISYSKNDFKKEKDYLVTGFKIKEARKIDSNKNEKKPDKKSEIIEEKKEEIIENNDQNKDNSQSQESNNSKMPSWQIALIAISSILGAGLVGGLIYLIIKMLKK